MLTLTSSQMKRAEEIAALSGTSFEQLMENAGKQTMRVIVEEYPDCKSCLILAGRGNNAGDGFVTARLLAQSGISVYVILCDGDNFSELAKKNFDRLNDLPAEVISIEDFDKALFEINSADLIIDAVYGSGFHGALSSKLTRLFHEINTKNKQIIALDMPSGIDSNFGHTAKNHLRANITVVYGALKSAHSREDVKELCGKLVLADIGISQEILTEAVTTPAKITKNTVTGILPVRKSDAHKGLYGKLLNLSGAFSMSGAAMMSTLSAMRTGAGIVRLGTTVSVANMITGSLMEAMVVPLPESRLGSLSMDGINGIAALLSKATAVLIGCGLSVTADTKQIVEYVINNTECNLIIDADGLNCLAGKANLLDRSNGRIIITPHIGEMARLLNKPIDEVIEHSATLAREFAKEHGVTVVLKSHRTIIASYSGELYYNETGNAGLAKGGSGDILAGMIGGFAAQGFSPLESAVCAVYIHGAAADSLNQELSQYGMLGRDVIAEIPRVMKQLGR